MHYAAHEPIDVRELGCDVLLCSPYKFCGPHLGIAYVRRELAETWRPYKARPSAATPVGRKFETGTLPYELLAGFSATIAYLDSIGGMQAVRALRARARRASAREPARERDAVRPADDGRPRADVPLQRRRRPGRSTPRISSPSSGVGVWYADNWYCVSLASRLPEQSIRAGIAHYNTRDEVDRLLGLLALYFRSSSQTSGMVLP